ncbi:MAG: hypothetical protein JNL58_10280 [Planctomyces sp.]|nr:hypothetical protein [Planctomyces sp.]
MKKRRLQQSDVVWASLAAILVLLQFWWLPGEKGTTSDSYSTTLDGKLGFYRTLSQLFPQVVRDQSRICPTTPSTFLMIAPDRYPTEQEEEQIYQFVYGGGNLLVAPNLSISSMKLPRLGVDFQSRFIVTTGTVSTPTGNTTPAADASSTPESETAPSDSTDQQPSTDTESTTESETPTSPNAVSGEEESSSTEDVPPGSITSSDEPSADTADPAKTAPNTPPPSDRGRIKEIEATSDLVSGPITWRTRSTMTPPVGYHWTPIVRINTTSIPTTTANESGDVEVAMWKIGAGTVMASSSPDIFSNRSQLYDDSRRLSVRLVEKLHTSAATEFEGKPKSIVLCEFLNASNSYRNTGVLFSPALRNGSLQLVLLAILAGWIGFHRFGPAVVNEVTQRRSLTESAIAVGNLQFRQQDGGAAIRSQLDYLRSQLRRRYGPNVRLEQPEALSSRTGLPAEEIAMKLKEAEQLAASLKVPSAQAAAMIRWLSELHARLSRTRSLATKPDQQKN